MSEKINILIVDDSPDKLLALEAVLEELGENVVSAGSGREALRRLLDQEFAVILLDVNMPDMDGFETAALVRSRKQTQSTPIIFVTSYGDETHASQGYSLGAVDYILAPVVPEVLRAKISVFVDLYRKTEQLKRQAEQRVALVREQAARAAAEEATRRFSQLAEASSVLARSLDFDATLTGAIQLFLERWADDAAITLTDEQNALRSTRWGRRVSSQIEVQDFEAEQLSPALATTIQQVLALEHAFPSSVANTFRQKLHLLPPQASQAAQATSGILIPLMARQRTLGVLTLFGDRNWDALDPADVALVNDLAERVAIALDNARLYRKIQEGDRRKDEFLAMLAHELRNPLGAISNALECLKLAGADPELATTARDVLGRQVDQITHLVDELLDVSRITRGKVELKKEVIRLDSLVARVTASIEHLIAVRQHTLSVSLPSTPVFLFADPTRLEQVLSNLLHNAAKFTDLGGQLAIAAALEDDQLVLRVRDNGIGISANLLPRIFELFTQGDAPIDRSQGGLGIGLTLVQSLVQMHGGRIAAFSPGPNQGSEFVIHLPVAPPAAKRRSKCVSSPLAQTVASRRILVVDDNLDMATTMVALLRTLGHEVDALHDGHAAVSAASSNDYDILFVDIGLPGLSGYEVAEQLRKQPKLERLLLVAVTGYGQADDHRRSRDAGFDDHLVKPVQLDQIQRLLAGLDQQTPLVTASPIQS